MEILTLLKANIRHKKGSFASIIILMVIITVALIAILSMQDNIYDGIVEAHERQNTGEVIVLMNEDIFSDTLKDSIESHALVREVGYKEGIPCYDASENSNTVYMQEPEPHMRLFDAEKVEEIGEAPELKEGEIYISQGMKTNGSYEIGDTITFTMLSGDYDFKVAGIVEDALFGASVIGWKNVYICREDFANLWREMEAFASPEKCTKMVKISIYKAEGCTLSDGQFARQLNLDTGIADMGFGSITKEMSMKYTYLFAKIIASILLVFILLLLLAVVLIICHSVSTGIEMEYTTLGIMKAQGFTKGKIRLILASQYLLAQIIGILLGVAPAMWLGGTFAKQFYPITGVLPLKHISVLKCGGIILGILVISSICIFVITGKIGRISPVRAISGGKREVHFDSRLQMRIRKKPLSASLALRQFTSNGKQYFGVIAIVSMLVFFMTTMLVLGNIMTADSAWKAMGLQVTDIDITLQKQLEDDKIKEIEDCIQEYSEIEDSYHYCGNYYYSVNGEQMMACVYRDVEDISIVSEGRQPLYDNEIVMTEIAAESMEFQIGDRVTLGYGDKKGEYIICGFNQVMNDTGVNFSITQAAAKKLKEHTMSYMGYALSDASAGEKIVDVLNEKYGELLEAEYAEEQMAETYELAIYFMTAIVYIFSVIFAVVVTHIVCSKAFLRERTDIGIYKAIGFTSGNLRRQFATRFLIVAAIGSLVGLGFAVLFSGKVLGLMLRMVGISNFVATFRFATFAIPIVVICVCFWLFSFMEAGRVKKVEVRELTME